MIRKLLHLVIITILFLGCEGLAVKEKIIGKYYLVAADLKQEVGLGFEDESGEGFPGVIDYTVFAVGFNNKFIIVKQHPKMIKAITNYYIIPIKNNGMSPEMDKELIGPLSLDSFKIQKRILKIPDTLSFTIVRNDLKY